MKNSEIPGVIETTTRPPTTGGEYHAADIERRCIKELDYQLEVLMPSRRAYVFLKLARELLVIACENLKENR